MNRPEHPLSSNNRQERSFSSDDTEFLTLPNITPRADFNRFEGAGDALFCSRISDFEPDSIDDPEAELSSSPPSSPSSSSCREGNDDSRESRDSTPIPYNYDKQWSSSDEESSFYKDKPVTICSEFGSPESHSHHVTGNFRCYGARRGGYLNTYFYFPFSCLSFPLKKPGQIIPIFKCRYYLRSHLLYYLRFNFPRNLRSDESTCCDDDFTWVGHKNEVPKGAPATKPINSSMSLEPSGPIAGTPSVAMAAHHNHFIHKNGHKPPRPASLDRRRLIHHHSRHERDSKSRSAHSLQEPSPTPDMKGPPRGKTLRGQEHG